MGVVTPDPVDDAKQGVLFIDFPPVLQLHLKRLEFESELKTTVKINDRYEIPLRLDLDQENGKYLSPDANRSVRNQYTLHSVLVHRGGVSFGHYYAFIRPTLSDQWFPKTGHSRVYLTRQIQKWMLGTPPREGPVFASAWHTKSRKFFQATVSRPPAPPVAVPPASSVTAPPARSESGPSDSLPPEWRPDPPPSKGPIFPFRSPWGTNLTASYKLFGVSTSQIRPRTDPPTLMNGFSTIYTRRPDPDLLVYGGAKSTARFRLQDYEQSHQIMNCHLGPTSEALIWAVDLNVNPNHLIR